MRGLGCGLRFEGDDVVILLLPFCDVFVVSCVDS